MFTPNSDSLYLMPAHFGGIDENQENERPTGWYHDVTVLAVSYVTDHEALARHLPGGLSLPKFQAEPSIFAVIRNAIG